MVYIPNDIMYVILEFSNNKNLQLVSKDFNNYLNEIRDSFLKSLDKNILKIKYQLRKHKRYITGYDDYHHEKSELEDENEIIINKKNINTKIGNIVNNQINFNYNFTENLIPVSYFKETSSKRFNGILVFWTINNISMNDLLIFKRYLVLV